MQHGRGVPSNQLMNNALFCSRDEIIFCSSLRRSRGSLPWLEREVQHADYRHHATHPSLLVTSRKLPTDDGEGGDVAVESSSTPISNDHADWFLNKSQFEGKTSWSTKVHSTLLGWPKACTRWSAIPHFHPFSASMQWPENFDFWGKKKKNFFSRS